MMEVDTENKTSAMENPQPLYRVPSVSATAQPLQPVSPDRQNQQRLPQSPSLPLILDGSPSPRKGHQHRLSDAADVKARVAYLNAVAQNNSPTRSISPTKQTMLTSSMLNSNNAAIQRAILGREEAESALTQLLAQVESMKAKERAVSERVESLMEQLNQAHVRQKHERSVYEKEIKSSKKTEYKAELAVIKLQEELREVRSELENSKARSEYEKTEKEKARQEAFERAYVVAGMTEENQDMKRRLEIAEQERDSAVAIASTKIPVEEEKIVRNEIIAEQEVGDKRKRPMSDIDLGSLNDADLEATDCPIELKYTALKLEVEFLRRKRQEDKETIHFMNMQCQFKACPCRMAERQGVRFVHDYEYDAKVRALNAKKRKVEQADPQLPLPTFKSWKQKQEEAKGKKPARVTDVAAQRKSEHNTSSQPQIEKSSTEGTAHAEPEVTMEAPAAPLPPTEAPNGMDETIEPSLVLEEASNIPLPPSKSMDVDATDDTLEPTAQLEDMTQVIVEPINAANNFMFSASTTNHRPSPNQVPNLQQIHNVRMSDDLFDISPPKRHMPPRPSTSMGVLTIESPTRLVAHSSGTLQQRSLTPDVNLARPTMTTRVALNDTSPVRQSRQQRQQSQPVVRDQSRGRSPIATKTSDLDRSSPAPSTVFPITPAVKNERNVHRQVHTQPRPQTSQDYYPSKPSANEVSTTTTIPLRDDSEQTTEALLDQSNQGTSSTGTPFTVPGTPNMTREQALAQIRARRDRARSVNMRKSAESGSKTPGSVARRGVNLKDRLGEVRGRDFSQASAPGRI